MFQRTKLIAIGLALVAALATTPVMAQNRSDSYAFLQAVEKNDGETVATLLAKPGSTVINTRSLDEGQTALHIVVRRNDLRWLRYLLGKGARTDIEDKEGNTPLTLAVMRNFHEGVDALLAGGAGVNQPNSRGETALILAVHNRDLPMVRLLMERGADPKRADTIAGYSALEYARRDGRIPAIVEALEKKPEPKREVAGPTF